MTALPHLVGASMKSEYTTIDDVRGLFTEDMNNLYLLSFLLTGNQGMRSDPSWPVSPIAWMETQSSKNGPLLGSAHHSPQCHSDNSASYQSR
jgi:hypothetical protein